MEPETCSVWYLELTHMLPFIPHSYDYRTWNLFPNKTQLPVEQAVLDRSLQARTLKGKANSGMENVYSNNWVIRICQILELSDFFSLPFCNTQKCDSGEIILSCFSVLSSIVVWAPQFKKCFLRESTYLAHGHHCCSDWMHQQHKLTLFSQQQHPELRVFTLLNRWGRGSERTWNALLMFLSYLLLRRQSLLRCLWKGCGVHNCQEDLFFPFCMVGVAMTGHGGPGTQSYQLIATTIKSEY